MEHYTKESFPAANEGAVQGLGQDYRSRIHAHYASNFQHAPAGFDAQASERWGRVYQHYLRGWLPGNKSARIIDLACGGGQLIHFSKKNGYYNISGVDISPEQVAIARQVPAEVELGNVLDFLEAHPNTYDLITGLDLVEHLQKPEVMRFLDGCLRSLRPGGRLILQTPNAESPWGMAMRHGDFTHKVAFSPLALQRLLKLSGFSVIEAHEHGPVPFGYSAASIVRAFAWAAIRTWLKVWNIVETGGPAPGVFTRVFSISGTKA